MDPQSDKSNDELLRRFRQDLRRPIAERYYSEEELACIFDNAGDAGDDYLRMEALLLGARLYPDSDELLERRAIFYRIMPDRSFDDFLEDNPSVKAPLWQILKMSQFEGPRSEACAMLDRYIASHSLDTDEEVIQLIATARDLHVVDWVFDNIELLKSKVDYLATLYYEVAMEADVEGRTDLMVDMLEKLTEIEPYNTIYWTMLSQAYLRQERPEEAASAIDFALAIDPRNADAILIKIEMLPDGSPEAGPLVMRAFEASPSNPTIAHRAIIEASAMDRQRFDDVVDKASVNNPDSPAVITDAIRYGYKDLDTLLTRYFNAGYSTPDYWEQLADTAYLLDDFNAANTIMQVYFRLSGRPLDHDFLLLKILFRLKQYATLCNVFNNAAEGGTIRRPGNVLPSYLYFILSLLRTGHTQLADEVLSSALSLVDDIINPKDLSTYGFKHIIEDIYRRIKDNTPTDWQTYDPLSFDK